MVRMLDAVFTTWTRLSCLCHHRSFTRHCRELSPGDSVLSCRSRSAASWHWMQRDAHGKAARRLGLIADSHSVQVPKLPSRIRPMRLSPDAAGGTRGPRFASPALVPTHTESHPSGPRSSRLRCRPAFAIPDPARPLFVPGSLGTRPVSVDTIFMTSPSFVRHAAYRPLHGTVQSGTPAFGG